MIKKTIKSLVQSCGYRFIRNDAELNEWFIISKLCAEKSNPFFVQIGANDGLRGDPIRPWVEHFGLSGVTVEPQPDMYERLVNNYKDFPNVSCLNCAISDSDERKPFFYVDTSDKALPEFANGLASFLLENILKHSVQIPNLESRIVEAEVECISLMSLMTRCSVNEVDILHVDVEGYDYEIIKQVDFDRINPKVILFEHKHLNTSDRIECYDLLNKKGYRLLVSGGDTMAYCQ